MWHTSIKDLIFNFKGALSSLLPWLTKSKISYDEQNGYDDWDAISEVLYETMVLNSIRYSDEYQSLNNLLPFARYDVYYEKYEGLNYVKVQIPNKIEELIIFRAFVHENNMDTIKVAVVNTNDLKTISTEKISFAEADFYVGSELQIRNLNIQL